MKSTRWSRRSTWMVRFIKPRLSKNRQRCYHDVFSGKRRSCFRWRRDRLRRVREDDVKSVKSRHGSHTTHDRPFPSPQCTYGTPSDKHVSQRSDTHFALLYILIFDLQSLILYFTRPHQKTFPLTLHKTLQNHRHHETYVHTLTCILYLYFMLM